MHKQTAIIDLGSNSIRLVIFEINEDRCYREIQNLKVVARLSSHIMNDGSLSNKGMNIIKETLDRFCSVLDRYNVSEIRGVATAAVRNASNRPEIEKLLKGYTEMTFDVISEKEEACYGYLAVVNSTDISTGITVDIGGGSTEITIFKDRKLKHYHSFPFGALTLKQNFLEGDSPLPSETKKLSRFLLQSFDSLPWLKEAAGPVIGIGGSARNLALVHQHSIDYPLSGLHQFEMTLKDVVSVYERLESMTLKKRQQVDGLSKDRADIILPAIVVIQTLIEYTGSQQYVVSSKGLREGVFFETLLKEIGIETFPNVTEESFYQLSRNYNLDYDHQKRISVLATYLAHTLKEHTGEPASHEDIHLLQLAARVFYIGESIHPESRSQHTFYLLTNQSIHGLSHGKRLGVALLASFRNRSLLNQYATPFRHWIKEDEFSRYEKLGAILRLAYGLDRSKQGSVEKVLLAPSDSKDVLHLKLEKRKEAYFEEFHAQKYKKHVERAFGIKIDILS
ncbi:Ppx/GppA family phosphatase [Bacillus sp. H-16]|uniref:Ppx/GppA phosphatase family protein n=1 Tax=Alteribacter salitolerans TaxID=2912333 RepID=UPI0019628BBC|nr:Ppx/GppA phosphatase family protein [Alteribacter salitolerans]MBM7097074.1 Ppx/GppA family phosphatase [Alteribacter salitolerans]